MMYDFTMNEYTWKSRWSNDQIRAMLLEQYNYFTDQDLGLTRSNLKCVQQAANNPYAVIISGLRRVGKSTLLAQFASTINPDSFYYLNFEDDRFLGFKAEDASDLYQILIELFGPRKIFFIDEIQNVPGWEHFVRRFLDLGLKFYITGSNAAMLSKDMGAKLTGRYVPIELFPFSFPEYLSFKGHAVSNSRQMTTVERASLNKYLYEYMVAGGIPDALKYPEIKFLQTLYNDVIHRDIAARYKLEAITALKELSFFLLSNPAGLVSFNKLKERLRLGSVNTVIKYLEYLENSWLLFTINQYSYSVKRQQIAPKKIYSIDTGMVESVGFRFSTNSGKLIENIAFLALRQHHKDIYYYQTAKGFEVDFYLPEKQHLLQVTESIENSTTLAREIRALEEAVHELPVKQITILTDRNNEDLLINGITVKVLSISEWLLTRF